MSDNTRYKNLLSVSNIITAAAALFIILLVTVPDVKPTMIQGLMNLGFFQPDIPDGHALKKTNGQSVEGNFMTDTGLISLSSLKGNVVFINFWATWCPPCKAEMPSIEQLYYRYKADTNVVFLMVDVDGDEKRAKAFLKKNNYTFPLSMPAGKIDKHLFDGTLPTTLILNRSGQVAMRHEGATDFSGKEFTDFLLKLKQ